MGVEVLRLLAAGEQHDGRRVWALGVGLEERRPAQLLEVAHEHDASLGHHRVGAAPGDDLGTLGLGAVDDVEVEVALVGGEGVLDEQALRLVDEVRLFAVEEVQRLEIPRPERRLDLFECERHRAGG